MTSDDRSFELCLIPGDGIGPEVVAAARQLLDAVGSVEDLTWSFTEHPAGHGAYLEGGDPLPASTVEAARAADGVLLGALDVAQLPRGVRQPLTGIRQELEVAASVRRSRLLPGVAVPTRATEVDILMVREVTEGLYSGIEYATGPDAACAVRLVTRRAITDAATIAFDQALTRRRKVTGIHKRGAMLLTESLVLEAIEAVAERYPDVEYETRNVDACAMELVQDPTPFDVILATNAFGDILSDVASGLVGGLGLAPSGCIGPRWSYFEPVHGTAPDIAGQGIANPLATFLTVSLLLGHLELPDAAARIERAVLDLLADGGPRTRDLGGTATTQEVTDAVCDLVASDTPTR